MALRTLAILSMLSDHLGFALYGALPEPVCVGMRLAGRLAMPIFCFLIAEGLFHTRSVSRYAGRLLLFGVISEIPFDLCFSRGAAAFNWGEQNVFFTLFLGLLAIYLCDRFALRGQYGLSLLAVLLCAFLAELIRADYGMFGVLFIFVFYIFRASPKARMWVFAAVCLLLGLYYWFTPPAPFDPPKDPVWAVTLCCAAFAALPVWLYNGKKGRGGRAAQIAFYAFYPVHLLLIALFAYNR